LEPITGTSSPVLYSQYRSAAVLSLYSPSTLYNCTAEAQIVVLPVEDSSLNVNVIMEVLLNGSSLDTVGSAAASYLVPAVSDPAVPYTYTVKLPFQVMGTSTAAPFIVRTTVVVDPGSSTQGVNFVSPSSLTHVTAVAAPNQ
jgi:hypothetical protein